MVSVVDNSYAAFCTPGANYSINGASAGICGAANRIMSMGDCYTGEVIDDCNGGFTFGCVTSQSNDAVLFYQFTTDGSGSDVEITVVPDATVLMFGADCNTPVLAGTTQDDNCGSSTYVISGMSASTTYIFQVRWTAGTYTVTLDDNINGAADCIAKPNCGNGIQDCQETGVDCGGPDCPPCGGTCVDGIQNQDEDAIDCGGVCNMCGTCGTGNCTAGGTLPFCCGTTYDNAGPASNYTINIGSPGYKLGNGTAGDIKICFSAIALNTAMCVGDYDEIRVYNNASALQFIYDEAVGASCFGSATCSGTLPNLCVEVNDGTGYAYIRIIKWCAGSSYEGWTATYETVGSTGKTVCVASTCSDGLLNGNETGIDCGGSCTACTACPAVAAGDAYSVHSPDALGGTVDDCEMTATAGTGGTDGLVYANGSEVGTNEAISAFPIIVEDNTTCTQVDVNYDAPASGTWNLGSGAVPLTPTGDPVTAQYDPGATGRKTIQYDNGTNYTYLGFQNIVMDPPSTGTVLGLNNTCPGTYNYSSSEAGTPGLTFAWTCSDPAGGTSSIASPAAVPTDVTFTNSTGGPLVFPLTLTITSGCCGALTPVLYNVTISNLPAEPVIVPAAISLCIGGSTDLVISPTTSGFNYVWYDAASGGTNLGGGITYTVSPVLTGATSYYAEAANSIGCVSATRDVSVVTGTDTPPTIPSITICMVGTESMCVTSPISGATYSWYAAATGGAPLSSGTANCYSLANAGGAGNVENIYVTVTDGTCDETTRTLSSYTIDVGCPNLYRSITTGDWFTTSTWEYSTDNGSTWTTPVPGGTPTSTDGTIQIRDGDNVTIAATVTYDEVTVELGGTLTYSVGTVTVANGTGVDLIINGTYVDEGSTSHSFTGNWKFGTKGRLIRANNGTCNNCWMDAYDGGTTCGNVPSTAEWIFRYTGAGTPSITSTNSGRNCYPTLIIENTSGGAWAGMSFIGSGFYPTVEGNLDVGGSSNAAVIFGSSNTNASPVLVKGSITVRGDFAHILNNDGTGFEIQGDSLSVLGSGTLAYSGSNDRLIKFSGSSEQNISGAGTLGIYDLTIDNSADSVQMNRTVTVDNNLTLTNGVLKLNAYTLTMAKATATITDISRTNGFIYSENENSYINWTNTPAGANIFVFPFVYDGEYIPFDFEKDGGDPGADIAIATWHTSVDNNTDLPTGTTLLPATGDANYIDRWYDITPSVVFDAELTFRWTTGELSGITPINTSYHWNGSAWDSWTGTTTGNNVTCTWTAYSGGGGGGGPLPISLLDFNATYNSQTQNVDLDWATASEENNDYFTIQKSRSDATDFDLVVQVPGAGSSNQTLYYEAVDENPYYGLSYYRLKQTDYDGTYTYSDLVAVNILKGLEFSVRPNPARDMLQIVFGSAKNNTVFVMTPEYNAAIKIYDTRGKLVYEKRFDGTFYKFNIDISGFQQGMYLVTLTANDEKYIAKFVKEN